MILPRLHKHATRLFLSLTVQHRHLHTQRILESLIPEGWPRGVADRFSRLQQSTLIQRSVTSAISRDVVAPLTEGVGTGRFFLIDGPKGVGKSALLLQLVEEARKNGVLVLYIPRARQWVAGDGFFSGAYQDDDWETGVVRWYDRPKQTGQLMSAFWNAHRELLEELPTKCVDTEIDGVKVRSLGDLVRLAIQTIEGLDADWKTGPARAGVALAAVFTELAEVQEVPVAIAIDEFESLLGMTCMENARGRVLHAHGIKIVATHLGQTAALDFAKSLKRGIFVAATSAGFPRNNCRRNRILSSTEYPAPDSVLDDPNGIKWLDKVREEAQARETDGSVSLINVPPFSREEAEKVLSEFQSSHARVADPGRLERLRVLAGGRADTLHKLCLTV